jgi:hypothetical protein
MGDEEKELEIILKSGKKIKTNSYDVSFHDGSDFKCKSYNRKKNKYEFKLPELKSMCHVGMLEYYLGKKDVGPLRIIQDEKGNSEMVYIPKESIDCIFERKYSKEA